MKNLAICASTSTPCILASTATKRRKTLYFYLRANWRARILHTVMKLKADASAKHCRTVKIPPVARISNGYKSKKYQPSLLYWLFKKEEPVPIVSFCPRGSGRIFPRSILRLMEPGTTTRSAVAVYECHRSANLQMLASWSGCNERLLCCCREDRCTNWWKITFSQPVSGW